MRLPTFHTGSSGNSTGVGNAFGDQYCDRSNVPKEIPTDPAVVGVGNLTCCIINAILAFVVSGLLIYLVNSKDESAEKKKTRIDKERKRKRDDRKRVRFLRFVLIACSDVQLVTGITIQATGLATMRTISRYHFFEIFMLSIVAMATHLATLSALAQHFRKDEFLKWLRLAFMAVNMGLSCTCGSFVLVSNLKKMPKEFPIACIMHLGKADSPVVLKAVFGTIAEVAVCLLVFLYALWLLTWASATDDHEKSQWAVWTLSLCVAISATVRCVLTTQAYGTPDVKLSDTNEAKWTYGAMQPLFNLFGSHILAIVASVRNSYEDKEKKPSDQQNPA